ALLGIPAAGALDEDAAHRLGRRGEEVTTAVPALDLVSINQPEVRLVDQGRGLERLSRPLLGHLLGRQLAEFVVHQRQELRGGVRVALFDGGQDAGNFAHRRYRQGGKLRRNVRAPIPSGSQNRSPPGAPDRVVRRPIYSGGVTLTLPPAWP